MLPAASSTPVSHSSMSAVKLGAKDLLRPLSQIRLSFKGSEERQIPALPAMVCHPAADQLQGWPEAQPRAVDPPGDGVPRASRLWPHSTSRRHQRRVTPAPSGYSLAATGRSAPGRPGDEELGWADPGPPLWASLSESSEPVHATQIGKICAANIALRGRSFTARRLRGGIDLGRRGLVG